MKNTLIINLFGAPGSGKSTIAAGLFYKMKLHGHDVELVTEFAKDLFYQGNLDRRPITQWKILLEQVARLDNLRGKVDYIITDSPLPLTTVYAARNGMEVHDDSAYGSIVKSEFFKDENICFLLVRNHEYQQNGRLESEDESEKLVQDVSDVYVQYGTYEHIYNVNNTTVDSIYYDVIFE